jgi:predicted DNA-binding ribbon-helix-helix protein
MGLVKKRSVTIRGHRTSYSLEQPFYDDLVTISLIRDMPLAALVAEVDEKRSRESNLSSALRLYVLDRASEPDAGIRRRRSRKLSQGRKGRLFRFLP